jgi:glycosyltransferase involved in cell wall biosynthesis
MPIGGTERQIVELLKGMKQKSNFHIAFGVLVKGGALEKEAMRWTDFSVPLPQRYSFDLTLAFSVSKAVKKYEIKLIHTFGMISDWAGLFATKINKIPYINGSIRSARPILNHRDIISRFAMPFADRIIANSYAGLSAFKIQEHSKTEVIKNGVDLNRFKDVKPFAGKCTTLCMIGNFTKKKDQSSLIHALPIILNKFPDVRLILIGRGPELDQCKRLILSLSLSRYINIITDTNHPEPYIAASQVGVLISPQGEGLSNVIIEYMALAKPVVATDLGGNSELVEDGKTGYLIRPNAPEIIAEHIMKLLRNPARAKQMGILGQNKIFSQFGLERMIDEYEGLYHKLLE